MRIKIPELSLVLLIGTSSAGKSTFAAKHFKRTEVVSSDFCRGLVCDDENDQTVTSEAFQILNFIAEKRLARGKLTVIDATNVQADARKPLLLLAKKFHVIPAAIVFNIDRTICEARHKNRSDRHFGDHVIPMQAEYLRNTLSVLKKEGLHHIHILETPEQIEAVKIERNRLRSNKKHEKGPFDIIGDIHGCFDELCELLQLLGYEINQFMAVHPQGRKIVFLGDLVDRGPKIADVLRLCMNMVENKTAFCIPGNHDTKLLRKLIGKSVAISHGLEQSLEQLEKEPQNFREKAAGFIRRLVSHYVFDGGNLVVAHAGMKEEMQGRNANTVRHFALYGETTGETDEYGLPIRLNWAAEYRGKAMVVYGHTPSLEPEWLNNTINIDTGCVFGGKLSALRYPEKEIISVPAKQIWYQSPKPF